MKIVTIETANFRIEVENNERARCYQKDDKFILVFWIKDPEICFIAPDFKEKTQTVFPESFYAVTEMLKWREYI